MIGYRSWCGRWSENGLRCGWVPCGAMPALCGAVLCGALRCDPIRSAAMRSDPIRFCAVLCDALQFCAAQCDAMGSNNEQFAYALCLCAATNQGWSLMLARRRGMLRSRMQCGVSMSASRHAQQSALLDPRAFGSWNLTVCGPKM